MALRRTTRWRRGAVLEQRGEDYGGGERERGSGAGLRGGAFSGERLSLSRCGVGEGCWRMPERICLPMFTVSNTHYILEWPFPYTLNIDKSDLSILASGKRHFQTLI